MFITLERMQFLDAEREARIGRWQMEGATEASHSTAREMYGIFEMRLLLSELHIMVIGWWKRSGHCNKLALLKSGGTCFMAYNVFHSGQTMDTTQRVQPATTQWSTNGICHCCIVHRSAMNSSSLANQNQTLPTASGNGESTKAKQPTQKWNTLAQRVVCRHHTHRVIRWWRWLVLAWSHMK